MDTINNKEMYKRINEQLDREEEGIKKITNELEKREYVKAKNLNEFIDRFEEVSEIVQSIKGFTKELEEKPLKVFKGAEEFLNRHRMLIREVLGREYLTEYQLYLSEAAEKYLQEWLRDNGIREGYQIRARDYKRYPSIYAVYKDNIELIQFSLKDGWYGIRDRGYTEEEQEENFRSEIGRLKEQIEKDKESIKKWENRKEKPFKYYKGFKDRFVIVFKKKKYEEMLDRQIKRHESYVEDSLLDIERIKRRTVKNKEVNAVRIQARQELETFFHEIGYVLNENRHQLY